MSRSTFQDSPQWRWDWELLCGPGGLKIWAPQTHDLGLCFQQLCLEIPVLTILACFSAYYFGRNIGFVVRSPSPLWAIKLRSFIILLMFSLPILQVYIDLNHTNSTIFNISYFLCAVQVIAWFVHFVFTLALRKKFGMSPRGPVPICICWSLLFVLTVISLRSHLLVYKFTSNPNFSIYLAYAFSICRLILQLLYGFTLIPGKGGTILLEFHERYTEIVENQPLLQNAYVRFSEDGDPAYLGVAMEDSNWLSKLFFSWVNPLMNKGVQEKLRDSEDLYDVPSSMNSGIISAKLEKTMIGNIDKYRRSIHTNNYAPATASISSFSTPTSPDVTFMKVQRHNVSLFKALHRCFWLQFYSIGILKLAADCSGFAGPLLLNKLVGFIEDQSEDIKWGYVYVAGLASTALIGAFCDSHFNFWMSIVSLKMRAALVTTIYRKTLTVNGSVLNSAFNIGEIVNFMSTDTDRIVNLCPSFHALWSIPFQLGVTLYLLYTQVGLAFLAGVAFSIALIPINKLIASKILKLSTKLMEQKDSRVKIMTEVLRGIKAIKLYVWEEHFIRIITKIREQELKYLKGRKYLDALCVYFWATTPVLISILTFGTYVLMGNKLTAATVFTVMALLNMLIAPLNAFPWVLNGMTEAWVSVKRIQKLLDLPDLDIGLYYNEYLLEDRSHCDIFISNASFNWGRILSAEEKKLLHVRKGKKSSKGKGKLHRGHVLRRVSTEEEIIETEIFNLRDLDLTVKKGEFIGIIGTVGCGKSSILSAILAELNMDHGEIATSQVEQGFGFVTQQPWLQRGTIRDNILFGKAYDDSRYKSVLFGCGLVEDIYQFASADLTGVGEGGTTLSGGQKARIALARAVYQDKAVYLLDDVLSAVDVHVAKHIFQHCIMGLLKDKTRILCTHLVQYLIYADRIISMENGSIRQQGKPAEVLTNIDDNLPVDLELGESVQSSSTISSLLSSIHKDNEKSDNDSLLQDELSDKGAVEFSVFTSYLKAVGSVLTIMVLVAIVMMQLSRNLSDWWLSRWVTDSKLGPDNDTISDSYGYENTHELMASFHDENPEISYYLKIYVEFAVFNSIFTLLRAYLFAYGGIQAASKLHKLLLKSIMKAKSTFFDISPVGRILNRFSSDTYTIDDSLPFILNILLAQFFGLIGIVIVTIYGLPWICIILVPLIPVYHWLQYTYRLTSRELKRISSVSLSPIYSHFNESLQGLSTIRAMRATQRFKRENEDNVEASMKAQFSSQAAASWLGLRLQFIGVAMITGVSFIAIIQHHYDVADPGLIGLALSYALAITGSLAGVINVFTETEKEMIAVERVNQYIDEVPPESTHFINDPPFGWPSQGVVTFKSVVLKYREHLMPSLNGVTFETRPSEKIGVVGRTGAGKSSLIAGLFRLVELESGSIFIDSVDISHIPIASLRSRLFCIPQEPFLFSGTLRQNLDPLGEFRDNEIWSALNKVNLSETIRALGGLENNVGPGGMNFSVGQKQLICLARAVLRNAKVLCIDEATANVDHETDRQIQLTLRSAFRKCTVITIAHRVDTVLDSDRVLVMSAGEVVEFDSPETLLANPRSYFHQLINQE